MRGNWHPHACRSCGWEPPPPRKRPEPVRWREDPAVTANLFQRRPELAQTATIGARMFEALAELA